MIGHNKHELINLSYRKTDNLHYEVKWQDTPLKIPLQVKLGTKRLPPALCTSRVTLSPTKERQTQIISWGERDCFVHSKHANAAMDPRSRHISYGTITRTHTHISIHMGTYTDMFVRPMMRCLFCQGAEIPQHHISNSWSNIGHQMIQQ